MQKALLSGRQPNQPAERALKLEGETRQGSSSVYLTAHGEFVALGASDAELSSKLLGGVGHWHFAEGVSQGLPERVLEGEVVREFSAPASGAQAVADEV